MILFYGHNAHVLHNNSHHCCPLNELLNGTSKLNNDATLRKSLSFVLSIVVIHLTLNHEGAITWNHYLHYWPITAGFLSQRARQVFDVFLDARMNKLPNKPFSYLSLATPRRPRDVIVMNMVIYWKMTFFRRVRSKITEWAIDRPIFATRSHDGRSLSIDDISRPSYVCRFIAMAIIFVCVSQSNAQIVSVSWRNIARTFGKRSYESLADH